MEAIRAIDDGVAVAVHVVPNARRSEVVGLHGGRVKIRLASPPEKNRANAELERLIAATCGVRRAEVVAGRTSRAKIVRVPGLDVAEVRASLLDAAG